MSMKLILVCIFLYLAILLFIRELDTSHLIIKKQIEATESEWGKVHQYQPMSLRSVMAKRLTDIIISFVICLTVLPLLLIIVGCLIKLDSKGPIFFKHIRTGLHGKDFPCYKFRSMYWNCEDRMAVPNDVRVTRVGRFIRKTHIDEIPQFFNILIGDMSIVGPRPLPKTSLKTYGFGKLEEIRALVRPGLTGYNQLFGRSNKGTTFQRFDMLYIKNLSWFGDIKIMLATLKFKDLAY